MQPIYDLQILNLISILGNPELSSQLNPEEKNKIYAIINAYVKVTTDTLSQNQEDSIKVF